MSTYGDPRSITPLTGTPTNRLFFAVNHYVSTGDHFGEGMAMKRNDGRYLFLIPVNVSNTQDQEDFEKFRVRFDELKSDYHLRIEHFGNEGGFEMWGFAVPEERIDELARAFRERPGAAGWGSGKAVIDQYKWGE